MRRAARLALLLAAAALPACGTTAGGPPSAGQPAAGRAGAGAAAPAAAVPHVSEAPGHAGERDALLRRVAALLEGPGGDEARLAAARQELERYLAQRPRERDDAGLALLGRLLGDAARLGGGLSDALRRLAAETEAGGRLRGRADALARENASLAAALAEANRERDELKALVQRLKELEMQMEEKRKRLR